MTDRPSRILAVLAYLLLLVGPVVLLAVRRDDDFVRYHSRQSLGLAIAAIGAFVAWAVAGWIISLVPFYGFLVAVVLFAAVIGVLLVLAALWITGMVNSLRARRAALPVIGRYIDRLFERPASRGESAASLGRQDPA